MRLLSKILILSLISFIFISCEDEKSPAVIFYSSGTNELIDKEGFVEILKYQTQGLLVQYILYVDFHQETFLVKVSEVNICEYSGKISREVFVLESLKVKLLYLSFNSTVRIEKEVDNASILDLERTKSILTGKSGKIVINSLLKLFIHSIWISKGISFHAIVFVDKSINQIQLFISK